MPETKKKNMKKFEMQFNLNDLFGKGLLFILIAVLFLPYLLNILGGGSTEKIALSQFVTDVREDKIERVEVRGEELTLIYSDGPEKVTR